MGCDGGPAGAAVRRRPVRPDGGAFIFGPLADKIGRKYALVLTVIFFGGASLASAWSTSITELTILRFLTGMGLGGAMPNAITLTSEFCPEKRRSFLTTLMFCGFTLGRRSEVSPPHRWWRGMAGNRSCCSADPAAGAGARAVADAAGIGAFLVLKNAPAERITAVLHKIAPEADLSGATYTGVTKPKGSPVRQLFQPGLVSGTLLIWLSFFMSLLVFYLLSSWLPTVISSAGMTLKEASLMSMMLQLGGTAGALLIGALMDRINPHTVLGSFYALAALFIALIGSSTASPWLLSAAVFGTGFCLAGRRSASMRWPRDTTRPPAAPPASPGPTPSAAAGRCLGRCSAAPSWPAAWACRSPSRSSASRRSSPACPCSSRDGWRRSRCTTRHRELQEARHAKVALQH